MKTFEEMGLSRGLLNILQLHGINVPTEIQEKAIPIALAGRDIVGGAVTGSGKTIAFSSVIIEKMTPIKRVQAFIITPTTEFT